MSAASEVNLKQTLRKAEFPLCAKEALNKIGELVCDRSTSIKNMDLALSLMSEFVFCEVDRRGNKRSAPLSPLLELQLLEILFEHFNNVSNEAARNTVFLSLFSGTTAMQRSGVLSKLVSLAIGIPSAALLTSASTWMQQLGNTSLNSCKLAEAIVHDCFHLVPSAAERMKVLPDVAPQFTANFLTAVAENYFNSNNKDNPVYPQKTLLETITSWISQNNFLCTAAQQKQAALPPGAIAMEATTAIAGLIRWCTLAPICEQDIQLYCRLHLALLNSILEIPKTNPPKAISAQHLAAPMRQILLYASKSEKQNCGNLQLSLDRYAQAIQVALSVNCVYGKISDLLRQLQQLPFNKLMSIVINTHKECK